MRWLSVVDLNTLNSWNCASRTNKIVYIDLAAAVDSKFDWEKIGKGALDQSTDSNFQFHEPRMNKESNL